MTFFVNVVPSLKILLKEDYEVDKWNDNKPVLNFIIRFNNHSSIKLIESKKGQLFTFNYVSDEEVVNEIKNLKTAITRQERNKTQKYLRDIFTFTKI